MLDSINSPTDLKRLSHKELIPLCEEIRLKIIDVMTRNGGHLASNLGTVELSVALHYVFNSPDDAIIFDVGHQCYTHKLLTGRRDSFDTIRLKGGLSGFTRRTESEHDYADAGHSSTSISQASGFALARKLKGDDNHVVAIIGDGSLTGGVAYEGLNFISHLKLPVLIILNDNDMSISKNVGGISRHIGSLAASRFYQKLTDLYYYIIRKYRGPVKWAFWLAKKIEIGIKALFGYENIFSNLGYHYIGPIDGHNIEHLIDILGKIKKNVKRPILLHVKTKKGKGFLNAEGNPAAFHGVTPYLMVSGKIEIKEEKTFTEVFAEKSVEMGKKYSDIVAITAAMESGTGLSQFNLEMPDRFFDAGIAEQHAVTLAGSLAYGGLRPILALYSTFAMRAIDQLIQDVCIGGAPVILALDRAGVVGSDGETHQGQFDISILTMLPGMTVMVPCDATELKLMFEYAYQMERPASIRYPKDYALQSQCNNYHPDLATHPVTHLKKGQDLVILVIGPHLNKAASVIEKLENEHYKPGLVCIRIIKPFPRTDLLDIISSYTHVLVIEENVYSGSATQMVATLVSSMQKPVPVRGINLPDTFIEHDSRGSLLSRFGFDEDGIERECRTLLETRTDTIDVSGS
jgi:1-deoxy-D-xylulose-5-phosphate synthase